MGSACTQVLADLYVRKWESDFIREQHEQHELYFRFRDDVLRVYRKYRDFLVKFCREVIKFLFQQLL